MRNRAWQLAAFVLAGVASAPGQIASIEMSNIAQGLDTCAIDTTYYVAPEALDDTTNPSSTITYNYIGDQGGTFVIVTDWGYFKPTRVNLITAFNNWEGPYLTYQPGRTQTASTPYDQGSPLDPWGTPYYMFSPLGLLRGDTGTVTLELYGDLFDRYTLVSLGPNGVLGGGDDVLFPFGGGVTATTLSSLRSGSGARSANLSVPAGSSITLRGTNLGLQTGAKLMWGSTELTNVTSWTNREVSLTLPSGVTGTNPLLIQRGASSTNALNLTITPIVTGVADWELFQ